ncbi:RING ZINC FINGER PROTEIN-RELATED [Salix purpurea]|uniref:RING ZINC FINGER PROTEIN-RELATED n=1 Tax=Salix purpurea TaxID=77065 RepID=A0A9Q0PE32_SALPP|nr:RING ZINC FINGER PROTEIN-RELATED [Salix purpurea]
MGFPVGYSEVFLPKLFVHTLSFLGFIRNLILCLFTYLGLSDFLETDIIWPDNPTRMPFYPPLSAALIREILPVIKFEDLVTGNGGCCDLPESCAVCLYEFEGEDEIRNSFVPDEMQEEFNQRLWAASNDAKRESLGFGSLSRVTQHRYGYDPKPDFCSGQCWFHVSAVDWTVLVIFAEITIPRF